MCRAMNEIRVYRMVNHSMTCQVLLSLHDSVLDILIHVILDDYKQMSNPTLREYPVFYRRIHGPLLRVSPQCYLWT